MTELTRREFIWKAAKGTAAVAVASALPDAATVFAEGEGQVEAYKMLNMDQIPEAQRQHLDVRVSGVKRADFSDLVDNKTGKAVPEAVEVPKGAISVSRVTVDNMSMLEVAVDNSFLLQHRVTDIEVGAYTRVEGSDRSSYGASLVRGEELREIVCFSSGGPKNVDQIEGVVSRRSAFYVGNVAATDRRMGSYEKFMGTTNKFDVAYGQGPEDVVDSLELRLIDRPQYLIEQAGSVVLGDAKTEKRVVIKMDGVNCNLPLPGEGSAKSRSGGSHRR